LCGPVSDGTEVNSSNGNAAKISGIYRLLGKDQSKVTTAEEGETVALGKLDAIATGETLSVGKSVAALAEMGTPAPVYVTSLRPKERKDDVKLSQCLQKLLQEDPSLTMQQN